jgi:hypothetical protein
MDPGLLGERDRAIQWGLIIELLRSEIEKPGYISSILRDGRDALADAEEA